MPNSPQAVRRVRTAEKAHLRNKSDRSEMRTAIKRLLESIGSNDATKAKELFPKTQRILDTLAKKGIIAKNTVSRYKQRLNKRLKAIANN